MAVEQVSVNILRILGLEATDDIDMESYKGFLREKLVMISMGKSGLSRDEEVLIQEEFKRVKSKPGSVKVKKTLVDPNVVFNRRSGSGQVKYLSPASGSLARRVIPQSKAVEDGGALVRIEAVIKDIWKNLSDEEKQKKKLEKDKKAQKDKEEKTEKESSLEKAAKGIVGALEKTFKPVTDIFKKIRDALVLLFLGWTANRLLDWIKDPNNLKTFNAIVDFLARNAGKLLLLYVALNSPLSKIIRWLGKSFIKFLTRMIVDLVRGKGLLKGARGARGLGVVSRALTNPLTAATVGTIGGAIIANEITGQRKAAGVQAENKARAQTGGGIGLQGVGGVGDLGPTNPYGMLQGSGPPNLSSGGLIDFGEEGVDQVPAKLTKGEFVVSKPAVDTFGADFFAALNKLGGGTNRPKYTSGVMHAAGGGYAGKIQYFSSNGGGNKILEPGRQYTFSDLRSHWRGSNQRRENGYPRDYTLLHGTNLTSSPNADIPAPLDSKVIFKGEQGGYGNTVIIRNATGSMLFGHLSKFGKIEVGQDIKAGTIIGTQGKTGGNFVDHLHLDASPAGHEAFVNFITSGKATFGSTTDIAGKTNDRETDPTSIEKEKTITFASESDRRLVSAYLNYITQPMGRGLDILPTIDQVSAVPTSSGPGPSPSNPVPSRPATNQNAERVTGAASRQIATPTR